MRLKFTQPIGSLIHRNQFCAGDVAELKLVGFAAVNQQEVARSVGLLVKKLFDGCNVDFDR